MTRDEILTNVRLNLDDAGVTYYQDSDIQTSIQDAYNDVAVFTGCIQEQASIDLVNNLTYYDMPSLISDFFTVVAIRNNTTNRWMDADSLKGFDNIRWDWELWEGQPLFYAPVNFRYIAVIPRMVTASGSLEIWYRATADILEGDSIPQIHAQEITLLEWYATGDLLDQAQEYLKADTWWDQYFLGVVAYKVRVGKLAKSDYIPVLESSAV